MAERLKKQVDEMRRFLDSEVPQRGLNRLRLHLCNSNLITEEHLSSKVCTIYQTFNESFSLSQCYGRYFIDYIISVIFLV